MDSSIKLHNHNVKRLTLASDGNSLYFLCGNSLCSWDLESDTYDILVEALPVHMDFLSVLPNSSKVLLAQNNGLYIFDPENNKIGFYSKLTLPQEDAISSFVVSPDARSAVVCSFKRTGLHSHSSVQIRIWDLYSKQIVKELSGHKNPVSCVFSPDGARLLTSSHSVGDHGIYTYEKPRYRVWSVNDGTCISNFGGEKSIRYGTIHSEPWDQLSSSCMDISANGLGIFTSGSRVSLVNIASWKIVRSFETGCDAIRIAKFSPDGAHVFALGGNQVFYSWNFESGEFDRLIGGLSAYSSEFTTTKNNDSFITTHSEGDYDTWIYKREIF
jgi:WD40 repeat protein